MPASTAIWRAAMTEMPAETRPDTELTVLPPDETGCASSPPASSCILSTPTGRTAMTALGILLLALATLVIAALTVATLRGLINGTLLVPEPAAPVQSTA